MDQVHVIRHKVLVEGQPIRQVAREMAISRNTVRKYLKEPEPKRAPERAEVYIPLVHRAGDAAQVDFFEVTVDVAGVLRASLDRQHWSSIEQSAPTPATTGSARGTARATGLADETGND